MFQGLKFEAFLPLLPLPVSFPALEGGAGAAVPARRPQGRYLPRSSRAAHSASTDTPAAKNFQLDE